MQTVAETTVGAPSGFVLVPENQSAWMAVRRLARSLKSIRPAPFPLLFLHGGPGTGKTRLLQSLQDSISEDVTRVYLRAADWPERPSDELRRCQVCIFEDLQYLPARAFGGLKEVLDARLSCNRLTIFSARRGPAELDNLPAYLANRLAGALIVGIHSFGRPSRRIMLEKLAHHSDRPVPSDVLDWLAEHIPGTARQLQAALCRVEAATANLPEPLAIPALADLFENEAGQLAVSAERIAELVGRACRVSVKEIRGEDRQPQIVCARQMSMYLTRKWTDLSLEQIGEYFGGRDPSTVRHGCRKIETALKKDTQMPSRLRHLEADLGC